jgi:hypothetical protein
MTETTHSCPKCNHPMEQGNVLDHVVQGLLSERLRLVSHLSHWAPVPASRSYWTAAELPDDKLIPIATYRCSSCGYLECYARREFAAR